MASRRAVSNVVGVVMILGLTVTLVTSLMVIGTMALTSSQADAEFARMENSMAQLSSEISLVALGDSSTYSFDLGDIGMDEMTVDPSAGGMRIYMENDTENRTVYETDELGVIRFSDGQRSVAFQAGGVWAGSTASGGRMVSPPEFHYRKETLTLPLIEVEGDTTERGIVSGEIADNGTTTKFPNGTFTNPVDNQSVFVEIESEYHQGWYNYLEQRSDGQVDHDPVNETVTMDLTPPFDEEYTSPIAVQDSYEVRGNPDINEDEIAENTNYPSVSREIDNRIEDCRSGAIDCEEIGELTEFSGNTTYFANESKVIEGNDITFDTTDGNITVVVDGVLDTGQEDIIVEGDNAVRIFVTAPPVFGNHEVNRANDATADQFRLYMHSDIDHWNYDENPSIRGVIYAPETDVEFGGSFDLTGTLIANSAEFHGAVSAEYDEALEDADLGFNPLRNIIRFLHVTTNAVSVEFD